MIRTEEEAKQKICCDGGNAGSGSYKCIASDCMAWRWSIDPNGVPSYEDKAIKGQPGMFEHAPMGYCGLAGKPEIEQ